MPLSLPPEDAVVSVSSCLFFLFEDTIFTLLSLWDFLGRKDLGFPF